MLSRPITDPATGVARQVSLLGLGCSKLGSFGNPASTRQMRDLLACALDLGITLFDTADIYGQGDSEREIGRALRTRPDRAFVVTKFGGLFSWKMRVLRPLKPVLKPLLRSRGAAAAVVGRRDDSLSQDFSVARLGPAVDGSLRRLGIERIDALLLHSPNAATLADGALAAALAGLKAAGKIDHYGVSVDDHAALRAASLMPGASIVQLTPAIFDEAVASGVAATLADRGIAILLREAIRARPALAPRAAIAAAVARPEFTCVLAGTSNPDHLRELVAAAGAGAG